LRMDRAGACAVFKGPRIPPDELVHPYLWPVASVFSRWHGREAFHAGALVLAGGAWALIGAKGGGKSSLLAAHALAGGEVLSDDLVVVEDERAFAGPRCIDLRRALPLQDSSGLTSTRGGTRLRMGLGAIAPALPLRGWIFLTWGQTTELRRVSASTCLARLARWRAWGELASDAPHLLALAGLPAYELTRERRWASLAPSLALIERLT
jgi:hypothetical protein